MRGSGRFVPTASFYESWSHWSLHLSVLVEQDKEDNISEQIKVVASNNSKKVMRQMV